MIKIYKYLESPSKYKSLNTFIYLFFSYILFLLYTYQFKYQKVSRYTKNLFISWTINILINLKHKAQIKHAGFSQASQLMKKKPNFFVKSFHDLTIHNYLKKNMVCTIIKLNKIDLYVHIHILQKLINKISEG